MEVKKIYITRPGNRNSDDPGLALSLYINNILNAALFLRALL